MDYIANRYRVVKSLGGNMAEVFLARDRHHSGDPEVAIKYFRKRNNSKLTEEFFSREVTALSRLDHPSIVKVLEHGRDDDGTPYLVMEFVEGDTLENYWKSRYKDPQGVVKICMSVLEAVGHAHARGVIHRDLKPENILVDDTDKIKIIDFGIAKIKDILSSGLTVRDYLTRGYAAPEQIRRSEVGPRADLFSIGAIAYWMLTGEVCENPTELGSRIQEIELQEDLRDFLCQLAEVNPENRPKSAMVALSTLRRIAQKLNMESITHRLLIANTVVRRLYQLGELEVPSEVEARELIQRDLDSEVHAYSENNSFFVIGRNYKLECGVHKESRAAFWARKVWMPPGHLLERDKEKAMIVNATWLVVGPRAGVPPSDHFGVLIDELQEHAVAMSRKRAEELESKDLVSQWERVLNFQERSAAANEIRVNYRSFRFVDAETVEVELSQVVEELLFEADQILSMTSRRDPDRSIDVGTLLDLSGSTISVLVTRGITETDFVQLVAPQGILSVNNAEVRASLDRQRRALETVLYKETVNSRLPSVLRDPSRAKISLSQPGLELYHKNLDDSKQAALKKALAANDIFLVQGPPGTGKTTLIAEFVYQVLKQNPDSRILIASQSHVAVDQALEYVSRVLDLDIAMVRVGRRDKISDVAHRFVLEEQLRNWVHRIRERSTAFAESIRSKILGTEESLARLSMLDEVDNLLDRIEHIEPQLQELGQRIGAIEEILRSLNALRSYLTNIESSLVSRASRYTSPDVKHTIGQFQQQMNQVSQSFLQIVDRHNTELQEIDELRTEMVSLTELRDSLLKEAQIGFEMVLSDAGLQTQPLSRESINSVRNYLLQQMEGVKEQAGAFAKIDRIRQEWLKRLDQHEEHAALFVSQVQVLAGTCLGVAPYLYRGTAEFDWVIVDEAARATPPELLVPMVRGKRILLVGDHFQLPPMLDRDLTRELIEDEGLNRESLETTLFEHLFKLLPDGAKARLNEQWRMHPGIGGLISETFYDGSLVSKAPSTLHDFAPWWAEKTAVWCSTSGSHERFEEQMGTSYVNTFEVRVIRDRLERMEEYLRTIGVASRVSVGVITGYVAQKQSLRETLDPGDQNKWKTLAIKIDTVDAFQGQETDVIFYSMVRSNRSGNLGFLADARRLNVALSRARKLLVIIGDHELAARAQARPTNPFADVISYMLKHPDQCLIEGVENGKST